MEFLKGSSFKLTGDVIVFSRLFGSICGNYDCLMKYASLNNEDNFIDSFRQLYEFQDMIGDGKRYAPFSKIPILMKGDHFFEEESCDVVYVGNFLDIFECNEALNSGLKEYKKRFSKGKYNLEYLSQLFPKRYIDVLNKDEIKDYVNEEYFKLMKNYLRYDGIGGVNLDYHLIKQNFLLEFEELKELEDVTNRFFNYFEFKKGFSSIKVQNSFLSLLSSICSEEYEKIDYKSQILNNLIRKEEESYSHLKKSSKPIIFDIIDN